MIRGRLQARTFKGFRAALFLLIAMICAVRWPNEAVAQLEEPVEMKPGDFREDARFLERFIFEEWEEGTIDVLGNRYVRERDVMVGRVDLNADGVDEIMMQIQGLGYCGSAGCDTVVLQRHDESWAVIGGGRLWSWVLTERVCGYKSLIGRDGIYRWNGQRYAFAYASTRETEIRSIAVYYDDLEWLNPKNGLIASGHCPDPDAAKKAPQGQQVSTTSLAVRLYNARASSRTDQDRFFDLLPGDYGPNAPFIDKVIAGSFENRPLPDDYSRARNVRIGRIDLNGDAQPELFIANYHRDACDNGRTTVGCRFLLFRRAGTDWRKIAEGRLPFGVTLLDETVENYRSFRGYADYYRWNGDRYEAVRW